MLSNFDYIKPETLEEALNYMNNNPGTRILSGGTDLMVLLRRNLIDCDHLLDIKGIEELQRLEYTPGEGLFIGATVNINAIADHEVIKEKYPAIAQSADTVASYQLRNRATAVGNICNASPGADMSSPLLVYNAVVQVAGPKGKREVPMTEFFKGVKKTALENNEMVVGVLVPDVQEGDNSIYLKQARIKGHDLGIAGVSVRLTSNKEVLIGMSAVAPTPIRLTKLEEMIAGKELTVETAEWLAGEVANHINPISDVRSSAEYRVHVSGVLAKRGLMNLIQKEAN